MSKTFAPGDLVFARGREWVALPCPDDELLRLRPLSGAEADVQIIDPALERDPVLPARFLPPALNQIATQDAARLLADALRLSLRRGAGPFRSAARLGFEPRAYQLVPLLMAVRLPVIRLLIADDVGIGKTIEAGLILREMIERGEADRFSVLCPPQLVEQWTDQELRPKFDIDAVAVTAASASRLERDLPASQTLFDAHPFTVVSLDYIKADRRRESFARSCPKLVVVDEAHACVGTHQNRQQRFELLKRLAADRDRHIILLTATPHSGDEAAFDRLLGLLDDGFSGVSLETEAERTKLARHFVQRRRIDITGRDWGEARVFPQHRTAEKTYDLGVAHQAFHDAVLDYCFGVVEGAGPDRHRRRLAFWGTLALMRCVGSSPAAALSALRNRLSAEPQRLEDQVFDDEADEADAVDVEPASGLGDTPLTQLIEKAERLTKSPDPKLDLLIDVLKPLIANGGNPVVFCRFIATAEHVAAGLRKAFPKIRVECITGALTSEDRRARIEAIPPDQQRTLVATDCLSEGINLQSLFDAVVHYDLSWNPTRHQQREGRIDRFGQPKPVVHSILLYSPDSAIDGAVLEVILRKAEAIRKTTGITVPLPEDRGAVTGALMNAVMLHKGRSQQLSLAFDLAGNAREMELRWRNAEEGEKRSRARFAQNIIKPEEAILEWQRWRELLGTPEQVRRFVDRAMSRLDAPLQPAGENTFLAHLDALPLPVKERLDARGLEGSTHIIFDGHPPAGVKLVSRNHPIPAILGEVLLESALDPSASSGAPLGRAGAWPTQAVHALTTVVLLRLRCKLTIHARRERLLLAEEANAVAWGRSADEVLKGAAARALLDQPASGNLSAHARDRVLGRGLETATAALDGFIADYVRERASILAEDHARVRAAAQGAPRVSVEPVLPPDIIGLYVLVPAGF